MSGEEETKTNSIQTTTVEFDGKTRYDWTSLSDTQQQRIVAAIKHMGRSQNNNGKLEPTTAPSTSQLFYVSSYHWNPQLTDGRQDSTAESIGEWCYHDDINFPMWHRIYIHIFERMMQQADKDLGQDGTITLPYWRWDAFKSYPDDLYTDLNSWEDLGGSNYWDTNLPVWTRWISVRNSSSTIINRNDRTQVEDDLKDPSWGVASALYSAFHLNPHDFTVFSHGYSSSIGTPINSIERPHGTVHVIAGGIQQNVPPRGGVMSFNQTAGYDPMFFMHHCNVDRLFERYITEVNTNSLDQFLNYRYPDDHPVYGGQSANLTLNVPWGGRKELVGILDRDYTSEDCFNLEGSFGAAYDTLDLDISLPLSTTSASYVYIPGVKTGLIKGSFIVYVLLVPNDELERYQFNSSDISSSPYLAGRIPVFTAGKGCKNCESRPASTLGIDVSWYLQKRKVSRHDVTIKGYLYGVEATDGQYVPLYLTHFGTPTITGPVFEDSEQELSTELNDKKLKKFLKKHRGDIKNLKLFLNKFGYYDGDINNIYDDKTIEAVKAFQKTHNLKETGRAGKILKKYILSTKRCGNRDGFVKHNKLQDDEIVGVVPDNFKNKKQLTYSLVSSPSYLKRSTVLEAVKNAFTQWSLALAGKITFKYVDTTGGKNKDVSIDIELDFNNGGTRENKDIFLFDGVGGILGHGGNGYVYFDRSEKWETNDKNFSDLQDKKTWFKGIKPNISLPYVALHEIGHALGLDHSDDHSSIMSPVYSPKIEKLQKDDLSRIAKLYQLY